MAAFNFRGMRRGRFKRDGRDGAQSITGMGEWSGYGGGVRGNQCGREPVCALEESPIRVVPRGQSMCVGV